MTLVTAPEPLMTETPRRRWRAKLERDRRTSEPDESSRMTGRMEDSLSLSITRGGLGLFLEPGGRPRGFLGSVAGESAAVRTICLEASSSSAIAGELSRSAMVGWSREIKS